LLAALPRQPIEARLAVVLGDAATGDVAFLLQLEERRIERPVVDDRDESDVRRG